MAWVTLITWADGDIPTAPQFNEQFRDNFNHIALHDHSGGSGNGAFTLGGPTGLQSISFSDGSAPGAPGGTLTAFYASNSTFGWVDSSGTAYLAANSTHTHTGSWVQPTAATSEGTIVSAVVTTVWLTGFTATSNSYIEVATSTHTVGGTGSRALLLSAHFQMSNPTLAFRAFNLRGQYTINGTGTSTFGSILQATLTGSHGQQFVIHAPLQGQPSGSYRVTAELQSNGLTSNAPIVTFATALLHEFQIK